MKKNYFFAAVFILFSVFFIGSIAYADDVSNINRRIVEMDQRIGQGIQSGALTRDESQRLRMELHKVREDAARMRRDNRLSPWERDRLNAELDRLRRDIYREANDRDRDRGRRVDISDINRRIAEMDQRIDIGIQNGALTRDESRRLHMELFKVREDAARMRRDNRLSPWERDKLNAELDRLKRHIYIEVKDGDRNDRRNDNGVPAGYTFCAKEEQQCSFRGTTDVAFGARGKFSYQRNISNGIACDTSHFGDPIPGVVKACYVQQRDSGRDNDRVPAGYTFCAKEEQQCSFRGTTDVAFGARGKFSYQRNISNGISCNTSHFGDPIPGVVKACYIQRDSR
jgi:hypothetical protein